MGAILLYALFCGVVIVAVITALVAGFPIGIVGQLGVWTVATGAIAAVLYRYIHRSG